MARVRGMYMTVDVHKRAHGATAHITFGQTGGKEG